MKNRLDRIEKLKGILAESGTYINKEQICRQLNISSVTLARYIKALRQSGLNVSCRNNSYRIDEECSKAGKAVFSKGSYVSLKILMYILNNNPCRREMIKGFFCSGAEADVPGAAKMSVRNLDIHIKRLIENNFIEKYYDKGYVYYRVCQRIMHDMNLKVDQCVSILNYLTMYKPLLPFQHMADSIASKLTNSLSCQIARLGSLTDDIKLLNYIVSAGLDNSGPDDDEEIIFELSQYSKEFEPIKIYLRNRSFIEAVPLYVIYNWKNGNWYLAFRRITSRKGFEIIKASGIESVEPLNEGQPFPFEELKRTKKELEARIHKSFGIALDNEEKFEVVFLDHFNVVSKAKAELLSRGGIIKELPDGSLYYCGYMEGAMDFMAWIRKFGSSVVIISPEWLKDKHIRSAHKVLECYGVSYVCNMFE